MITKDLMQNNYMPNKLPFLPKIDQTASHHNHRYALSRFAYFDQKSSLFGLMAYFARGLYCPIGFKMLFISEKRSKTYVRYVEVSIARENSILDQELLRADCSAGWQAKKVGNRL